MSCKAFLIAKEIVESEETFIQVLRLLNEVCHSSSQAVFITAI